MAEIKNITDKEGEVVYPVTKINAVYTQDNKRLDNVMLTVGDSVGSTDAVINAQTLDGKTREELVEYSTEEKRIGTWIDGKPIYRKTFTYSGNITTNSILFTSEVGMLIDCYGVVIYNANCNIPVPYASAASGYNTSLYVNTDKNVVWVGNNYNNATLYVTLEYTK